jgi:uncharacterized protein (DUF2236 family)
MCSHANLDNMPKVPAPEMGEQTDMNTDEHFSEKEDLPVVPSPDLECLSPDYNPTYLQTILREGILLATGGVAVLLQMAHPGVAQGVDEYSNFAYRPSDRLRTTMTYMYCMAFGTTEERRTIIEMVHRAHVPVKGPGFTANDPDLQLWVAATLYACGVHMYQLMFGTLDAATDDKVYQEYSVMATSLRVPAEKWPKNREAFWEYWDENVATLPIGPNAKNVCNDLLHNKRGPFWLRMNLPVVRIVTAEQLPPRLREEYGINVHHGRYRFLLGLTKSVYPHLPSYIRQYPLRYYLKDMRKRMKKLELSKSQMLKI